MTTAARGVPVRGHHLPALGVVVVAVLLLVGLPHLLGDAGRLAAVLVLQLALVVAWVVTTGIEGLAGSLVVGALAAGAADLVLVLPARPSLGGLLAVLGIGFLAGVLQQMLRRPRPAAVASLSGGVLLLCAVCALAVLLLQSPSTGGGVGTAAVLAIGAALVVGHLVDLVLPRPRVAEDVPRGLPGLVLAVAAGVGVAVARRGGALGGGVLTTGQAAVLLGAALGVVAALTGLAASYLAVGTPADDGPGGSRPWAVPVVQAVLPLAACAPVALALQAVL